MNREEIIALFEKYAVGKLSAEEEKAFYSWVEQASPEEFHDMLNAAPGVPEHFKALPSPSPEFHQRLERRLDLLDNHRRKIWTMRPAILAAAASIVLLALAAAFILNRPSRPSHTTVAETVAGDRPPGGNRATLTLGDGSVITLDSAQDGELSRQGNTRIIKQGGRLAYNVDSDGTPVFNTITTPNGGQYRVELPDGSLAWLNAASSLRFPSAFKGEERLVELKGEGYFEVAANAAKPFRVKLQDAVVEVLGTHFNVNAYADEERVRTTLLEGAVRVRRGEGSILLKPGQQAQMDAKGNLRLIRDADTEQAIAWKNGYFQFDGASLPALLRQIARWYNLEVVYEGNIPDREFGGKISRDVNLSSVLKALQVSGVNFKVSGNKLVVTP